MEELARKITINISHAVEILSAIIIAIAVIRVAIGYFNLVYLHKARVSKEAIRLELGSSVAVSLELLLGADVLATAVAPNWNDIGHLAAIAVIRTALNYFLAKELKNY